MEYIPIINFDKATLDKNVETFVTYINSFLLKISIYSAKKTQITLILVEKV